MDNQSVGKGNTVKRPLIITVFCIFVMLVHGADLIRSFGADRLLDIFSYIPLWYILLLLFCLYPLELFGIVEIWKMKRRGLIFFGLSSLIWVSIWIYYIGLIPNTGQVILLVVFLSISLIYYPKME